MGKLCVEMVAKIRDFPYDLTKLPPHILVWLYGGFHSHGGTPLSLDGFLHGKSHLEIDDWEYPCFRKPPIRYSPKKNGIPSGYFT